MTLKAPDGAIDTNFWDLQILMWQRYQDAIDNEFHTITAIICGATDVYKPKFRSFTGGHYIGKLKYLPAYYKMSISLSRNKKYYEGISNEDDSNDNDDEDVRHFEEGDRELSR